jgi:aminomethyltransferase
MGWAIHWDHDFIGRDVLEKQKAGEHDHLLFLRCTGRGIPRHGHRVELDGEPAGVVTSGTFSPCLKTGIAMAYVTPGFQDADMYDVVVNDRCIPARSVKPPFVEKGDC